MKAIQLDNAIWKEGDYFVAQCLNVDVSSFGDTEENALKNLLELLSCILKTIKYPSVFINPSRFQIKELVTGFIIRRKLINYTAPKLY